MVSIKVYFDQHAGTLTVWFGDPETEHVCEETGDEVILMKDRFGQVIGFEKLNFNRDAEHPLHAAFETITG